MNKILLTLGLLLASASSAIAVDLVNRDNGGYEVRVTANKKTSDYSIDGLTAITICNSSCQVEVKGVGVIQANQNQTVVIENRTLRVQ